MTDEQQSEAWAKAKAHEAKLVNLPEKVMAPMKAKICASADHQALLYDLGG
jgi:hypothetical protein